MKKKIQLKRTFHHDKWRIAICFDIDEKLKPIVRSIKMKLNSMKDKKGVILISCYITELALALLIFFLPEITGYYLIAAVISVVTVWLIIIIISIVEVIKSERIGVWEKVIWVVGILSVLNLAGIVYIILRRWRIIDVKKQSHS